MITRRTTAVMAAAALLALASGCRIEKKAAAESSAGTSNKPVNAAAGKGFDPKLRVAELWDAKVIPALQGRAGEFNALRQAMKADLDAAGALHGHRERGEGAPWNFATRLQGRIIEVNTESPAGRVGVDTDGDGKADAQVQIGPVIKGTALRDALAFVSFTDYGNQVEFAQLANAFNDRAEEVALKRLPREGLQGRTLQLLGVFTTDDADEAPLVLPVQATLVDAK